MRLANRRDRPLVFHIKISITNELLFSFATKVNEITLKLKFIIKKINSEQQQCLVILNKGRHFVKNQKIYNYKLTTNIT